MKPSSTIVSSSCEKDAIERCIRSFIIKSIHAVVQGRSGVPYNTNCVSDVGARNNLMVHLEEDPEIGSTIKQALESGFPVRSGHTYSLEILIDWFRDGRSLMVLEVWQFSLNTEDSLLRLGLPCSKVVANHSGIQPAMTALPRCTASSEASPNDISGVAVEDFRQSRLFERLGTLLKTIIVTTRLLPAYEHSRKQQDYSHQMCYILRRGESDLSRLGPDFICRQVAHLFPGLAVPTVCEVGNPQTASSLACSNFRQLYLNISVRYRTQIQCPPDDSATRTGVPLVISDSSGPAERESITFRSRKEAPNFPHGHKFVGGLVKDSERSKVSQKSGATLTCQQTDWVRPAFATNFDDLHPDDGVETTGNFFRLHAEGPLMETDENEEVDSTSDGCKVDFGVSHMNASCDTDSSVASHTEEEQATGEAVDHLGDYCSDHAPLQLPFSTVGISGARLTHLFSELRTRTDLDLFRVPAVLSTASTPIPSKRAVNTTTGAQSVFDADTLADELERHERTLKNFDDFLADFVSMEHDPYANYNLLDVHTTRSELPQ